MASIRIALAQINVTVGDLAGNRDRILAFAGRARHYGAEVVVFPELSLSGYPPEDLLLKPHFLQENSESMQEIAARLPFPVAILGYPARQDGRSYNSAAIVSRGEIQVAYHKILLPNYGVFDEKRYFEPGSCLLCLRYKSVLFGITICEDIWDADGPCRGYATNGVQVIINISASPYHSGKMDLREQMLRERATQCDAHILYCNLVGGQDELVFDGGSLIVSPQGTILARGKQFAEDLLLFDLTLPKSGRKPGCPVFDLSNAESKAPKPPLPLSAVPRLSQVEEVYSALSLGLRDYVLKNGFSKVILGLSGGIDSALTACVAVDALGPERVEALSMPSAFSSEETQRDARALAENLGIKLHVLPITSIYEAYLVQLRRVFEGRQPDVTEENIQARVRGNILMAFSNKFGHLVLTTGNKSETSVGYCTLYGDTAGGFAVLKDVYKTLVYRLARFVNEKAKKEVIPQTIFHRPPTAELKPDQKDEDTLPPYHLLDRVLESYIENDESAPEIISEGLDHDLVLRVMTMVDRNEYKRRQAPPGIKITPKAFGRDRRMPITNKFLLR